MKKTLFHFFILVLLGAAGGIQNANAKKRVVLLPFDGKANRAGTRKVRNFIKTLLKGNYEYVTKKSMKEQEGKKIDFRNISAKQIKDLSEKFAISAFVGGKARRKGWRRYVTIIVYNWKDGTPAFEKEFRLKRAVPRKKQLEAIAMATLQAIENLKEFQVKKVPVKEVEPEIKQIKDEEKPEELIKTPIVKRKKVVVEKDGLPALRAGMAFGFFTRALDFDPASEPYYKTSSLSFAPVIDVEVYPMAFGDTKGALANIGLGFKTFYMPGFKTYPANDKDSKINTMVLDFGLDLRYRHQITNELVVGGKLGYQNRAWTFENYDILDVPGVSYSLLEVGGFARFTVAKKVVIEGGLSMLLPLDAGDIVAADFYGEASLYGIKFNALFGYKVLENVEVFATFGLDRFSFSFNDAGTRSANSAVDQYLSFAIGGRYVY